MTMTRRSGGLLAAGIGLFMTISPMTSAAYAAAEPVIEKRAIGTMSVHDFAAKWMMQQGDLADLEQYRAANEKLLASGDRRPRVVMMSDSITYHWTPEDLPAPSATIDLVLAGTPAQGVAGTTASVAIAIPPPECQAHVGYDRERDLPGYLLPDSAGKLICIPFSATAAHPPEGYKGDFYVDAFTDAKLREDWCACKADPVCYARARKPIERRVPPNGEYKITDPHALYLLGKVADGPDIDLKTVRRPPSLRVPPMMRQSRRPIPIALWLSSPFRPNLMRDCTLTLPTMSNCAAGISGGRASRTVRGAGSARWSSCLRAGAGHADSAAWQFARHHGHRLGHDDQFRQGLQL